MALASQQGSEELWEQTERRRKLRQLCLAFEVAFPLDVPADADRGS